MIEAVRRANAPGTPEDSIPLRVVVLGAVMTGMATLASVGALSAGALVLLAGILPFAYWISYVRRRSQNWGLKFLITIGAVAALVNFLTDLRAVATLDEIRFPLASLFVSVQVLHSLDLPARKDLNFSLASSLTLMAVAGTLSQDTTYGAFLIVYFGFVMASLTLSHRSELAATAPVWLMPSEGAERGGHVFVWKDTARAALPVIMCAALIFLVIPQSMGTRSFALPFSLGSGLGSGGLGGISNPGFSGDDGTRSSASSFHGFDNRMDLNVRGDLSDELVMRVRAPWPAMWKGLVFDTYDGSAWEGTDEIVVDYTSDTPPYPFPPEFRSLGPRATMTQTFYIEAEQPNVIFAAGQPDSIWFDGGVTVDELGGVRTSSTLTGGTVYSVVSSRGSATPSELRALPPEPTPPPILRYLDLPGDLPKRVADLAERITRGEVTDFDRVEAIEEYLRKNYRYSLDSPVPPPGRDAVDHFLFEANVGFCEQFASATAVMLRTLGIPARVVAGYAPGTRNPFTGYYDVRGSDAHAWVEVWFPDYGWYEFDPTFAIPPADPSLADSVPLLGAVRALVGAIRSAGPVLKGAAGVIALTAIAALVRVVWRLGGGRARSRRRPLPAGTGPVTAAFRRLEDALEARGEGRAPPETASEMLARTARFLGGRPRAALAAFERERYGQRPPSPPEIDAALDELEGLVRAVEEAP